MIFFVDLFFISKIDCVNFFPLFLNINAISLVSANECVSYEIPSNINHAYSKIIISKLLFLLLIPHALSITMMKV